ncbi:MAG: WYL domain-containing protein [Planctomycetota bacterium]
MKNLARYEQFLRITTLLDILSTARGPLDDQALISAIKERLGLSRLSPRTLHRDCEFLITCGYPVDHAPLQGDRRYGWRLDATALANRKIPAEPLTILELAALTVARELLRAFEGTVLWTGIESLRSKLERNLAADFLDRAATARDVFRVAVPEASRYASRPRLLSALSSAISESREIEIEEPAADDAAPARRRLQPAMLVIDLPRIRLAAWEAAAPGTAGAPSDQPVLIDLDRIARVKTLDTTFTPRAFDPAALERA